MSSFIEMNASAGWIRPRAPIFAEHCLPDSFDNIKLLKYKLLKKSWKNIAGLSATALCGQ